MNYFFLVNDGNAVNFSYDDGPYRHQRKYCGKPVKSIRALK